MAAFIDPADAGNGLAPKSASDPKAALIQSAQRPCADWIRSSPHQALA
jgi:hypothetical protein